MTRMSRHAFRLPDELWAPFLVECRRSGTTASAKLRQLMVEWLALSVGADRPDRPGAVTGEGVSRPDGNASERRKPGDTIPSGVDRVASGPPSDPPRSAVDPELPRWKRNARARRTKPPVP